MPCRLVSSCNVLEDGAAFFRVGQSKKIPLIDPELAGTTIHRNVGYISRHSVRLKYSENTKEQTNCTHKIHIYIFFYDCNMFRHIVPSSGTFYYIVKTP
jgi:hypothetical protein